ncbi:MAG: hypothetical protein IKI98_05850 [Spirochaetaceae bacterium]|nr:hypothetical protein [Spirochaetaceae bacterium]
MNNLTSSPAWYSEKGIQDDVICSTRIRLARNLADFPFPSKLKDEDRERVQALIFDAFSRLENSSDYQSLSVSNLELLGRLILAERGVLTQDMVEKNNTGVVIRSDGKVSCTVNSFDHLHLSSFSTGLNLQENYELISSIDSKLQDSLQFAGMPDFGYLSYRLRDTGTGMKISMMLHLPALSYEGLEKNIFKSLVNCGFDIFACFSNQKNNATRALGSYFRIATNTSFPHSETDQIAQMVSIASQLMDAERQTRSDLMKTKPTLLKDKIYRALATIKYSRFISLSEGIELISAIKLGKNCNLFTGIEDSTPFALLYRIQTAHLGFVIRSGNFNFEDDVTTPEQQTDRLRALVLQETVSSVYLV